VSVEDGYHLWSESYDRELKNVFEIQDEISRSIVDTLRPTLLGVREGDTKAMKADLVVAPTRSLDAYDNYLLGRHYWEGRYEKGISTALRYFESAVELDPEYALPYTGVADSYTVLGLWGYLRPQDSHSKASSAALRALELDEGLSEAHGSLGFYEMYLGLDWERSGVELLRAIELNPDNSKAHVWLGFLRGLQGRFQEAFDELARARRLDPLSTYVSCLTAVIRLYHGEADTAAQMLEEALVKDPEDAMAVFLLPWAYINLGRWEDAVRAGERAVALSSGHWQFKSPIALCYARTGRVEEARTMLNDLMASAGSQYVSPMWLWWIHLALGEYDAALDRLSDAVATRTPWVFSIHQDPFSSSVWSMPRFWELASKVGSGVVSRAWERQEKSGLSQVGKKQET
jgi:tetratricopeptide (TPR) repeat protein